MTANTLPVDSNSKPAEGLFDPTTGHVVAGKSGTVATSGGTEYAPATVNIADPTTPTSQLAVNTLGQIAVSNFPSTQSVIGTVSVAQFPSVQPISGSLDVNDRSSRQLGHVVVDLGGAGTNTAPGYAVIQDPTTNSHKMAVNADGSVNVSGTISATNPSVSATAAGVPASATYLGANKSGNIVGLTLDSSSNLNVNIQAGTVTATNPSVGTDGSVIPTSSTLIGASDGTNLQQLLVESSANKNLRTGIYSGTNEATVTGANALKVDNSAVTQPVSGTFWQSTQPVSNASLPLPTGASTSAKQPALGTAGTASTDVLSVQGIVSMTPLKVDGSGATQPISGTITANVQQADLSTTGTISTAQPVVNTPVSNATVVLAVGQGQSTWKAQLLAGGGGFTSATTIVADKSPDGGTTWYSASFKVTGAAVNTPVSSIVGPGPLDLTGNDAGVSHVRIRCSVLNSTETIAVTLRSGVGISDVNLLSPLPTGSNLIGGMNVVDSAGTNKLAVDSSGRVTEASAATIATNTGNIPAKGQATMINSTPVAIASNQSAVPISQPTSATGTITSVAAVAASTSLLASNTSRKGAYFYNDSTAILYLALAGSASTSTYTVQVPANGFFEMPPSPVFTGAIFGIWSAANGNVRITELT